MKNYTFEVNFDGIVGPTHHYGGLSYGNVASMQHYQKVSNPKDAARQGILKMRSLMRLGLKQGVLPPQERPLIPFLRSLGYTGSDLEILKHISQDNPALLSVCNSSASMWTANAATICPSVDAPDGKVHFTPANLLSKIHRSFEPPATTFILKKIFANADYFVHHDFLPVHEDFADEGAANHTRLCQRYGEKGVQLFVFGRYAYVKDRPQPKQFPARQTFEASEAIARLHGLPFDQVIYAQQNPAAIDAGVFHNDVISVGNQNVFFYHEKAFVDTKKVIDSLQSAMQEICHAPLFAIEVKEDQVSLKESVRTYLFNSQLVTIKEGSMALIAPFECQHSPAVKNFLFDLIDKVNQPIEQVIYQDVHESMQNGGGPACLRLRVVLNERELSHVHKQAILTEDLSEKLIQWVENHYRDQLTLKDLADPQLLTECHQALDALTQILDLGSLYSFQQ